MKNPCALVTFSCCLLSSCVTVSSQLCTETKIFSNDYAFAVVNRDGSVEAWGNMKLGGSTSVSNISKPIETIYSNSANFLALSTDGSSVFTWGEAVWKYQAPTEAHFENKSVLKVTGTQQSFAILFSDGTVLDLSRVSESNSFRTFDSVKDSLVNVVDVVATKLSFAALANGTVVTWGNINTGSDLPPAFINANITHIYSTSEAFLAVGGSLGGQCWGNSNMGGDCSNIDFSSGIKTVFSNEAYFTILKNSGEIVTWPKPVYQSADVPTTDEDVHQIFTSSSFFAAHYKNKTVVVWGSFSAALSDVHVSQRCMDLIVSSKFLSCTTENNTVLIWGTDDPETDLPKSALVQTVANEKAFAAITEDGQVVAWGAASHGGEGPVEHIKNPIRELLATKSSFLAVAEDGSITAWGDFLTGANNLAHRFTGPIESAIPTLSSAETGVFGAILKRDRTAVVLSSMTGFVKNVTNVIEISHDSQWVNFAAMQDGYQAEFWGSRTSLSFDGVDISPGIRFAIPNLDAYTAIKLDGSVFTWGASFNGNVYPNGQQFSTQAKIVVATFSAFAVLLEDKTVVCFGDKRYGGECPSLQDINGLYSNTYTFVAVQNNTNVVAWPEGNNAGGDLDGLTFSAPIKKVVSSSGGFAALQSDGFLGAWGTKGLPQSFTNIKEVYSTKDGFAALEEENGLYVWGGSYSINNKYVKVPNIKSVTALIDSLVAISYDETPTAYIWPGMRKASNFQQIGATFDSSLVLNDDNSLVYTPFSDPSAVVEIKPHPTLKRTSLFPIRFGESESFYVVQLEDGSWETIGNFATFHRPQIDIVCVTPSPTESPSNEPSSAPTISPTSAPTISPTGTPTGSDAVSGESGNDQDSSSGSGGVVAGVLVPLLVLSAAGGYFYYKKRYLPSKLDSAAKPVTDKTVVAAP